MSVDLIGNRLQEAIERWHGGPQGVRAFTEAIEQRSEERSAAGKKPLRGANRTTVQRYLSGESPPPADFLAEAADLLGVSIGWLFTGQEETGQDLYSGYTLTQAAVAEAVQRETLPQLYEGAPTLSGHLDRVGQMMVQAAVSSLFELVHPDVAWGTEPLREYHRAEIRDTASRVARVLLAPMDELAPIAAAARVRALPQEAVSAYVRTVAFALRGLVEGAIQHEMWKVHLRLFRLWLMNEPRWREFREKYPEVTPIIHQWDAHYIFGDDAERVVEALGLPSRALVKVPGGMPAAVIPEDEVPDLPDRMLAAGFQVFRLVVEEPDPIEGVDF